MCGIAAYFGSKPALPFLLVALPRLEYRGYDGAGYALIGEDPRLLICKVEGKIEKLIAKSANNNFYSCVGFAHTRWATHGNTAEINSHPHVSNGSNLIGVHNGTIENYLILKKQLEKSGYVFYSQTDTEVLINFIDWICKDKNLDLVSALQIALLEIVGTCALVIYSQSEKKLVAVNKGGHLCAGINGADVFIASDKIAFAGYSEDSFEIGDGQFLIMEKGKEPEFLSPDLEKVRPFLEKINVDIRELELGDFPNFTLKEIYSQPDVIRGALAGRVDYQKGEFCFGGLDGYWPQIKSADSLTIVACGTSYYAGLLGKSWLEKLAGLSVKVEDASEFQPSVIGPGDLVLGISQSGTTADTLAALKAAKDKGAIIFGVCNVVESPLARLTHAGIYTRAGVENGVASTKAFTAQAIALLLFALKLSKDRKRVSESELTEIINQLEGLPEKMEQALATDCIIESLAKKFKEYNNYFYLGRG
ncbi:MAG: glutamine--fructose-6-phosphate transaminase (isomerizing), partial [Patescibacteria group bacterium]